jgi:flavodoxin
MKTIKVMFAVAIMALMFASCGKKEKILVLYYSQTGNTKAVAEEFANRLGADIEEITAIVPYDGDFQATIERCKEEMALDSLPDINCLKHNINEYDVIFIGYPVWFGTYAPPIASFLKDNNLSGKKIVPFCTFGSGGLFSSSADLAAKLPEATILPGYGIRAARIDAAALEVDYFLQSHGYMEGEFAQLEEFPASHPVSAEEAAIFDAAVGDYPMIQATATEVACRTVPEGVEYLFTAQNKPREGMPAFGPMEMKVYVLVAEGQPPVFTQVVR